ncbi:MAG TPA: N-acetylmuramoyl-L-alanine amidase, partial [Candidatus Polarisedimenticolia bacterium]
PPPASVQPAASGHPAPGAAPGAPAPRPAAPPLRGDETPVLKPGGDLFLEIHVGPGASYTAVGQRYLADLRGLQAIKTENGSILPNTGGTIRIPYTSLNDEFKMRVIRQLFPRDAMRDGDWVHRVGTSRPEMGSETLWHLALWLTGRGENYQALAERNGLDDLTLRPDQQVIIPGSLLRPPFTGRVGHPAGKRDDALPVSTAKGDGEPAADEGGDDSEGDDGFTEAPSGPEIEEPGSPGPSLPALPPAEGAEELRYGHDSEGRFAVYRLKRGEALYSAVVVRYTGRIDAPDVNELAQRIARRSGIREVTDIPIGFKIRVPLDLLLPEYLPPDDERRQAWERSQAEVARYTNEASSRNLQGVTVILDAGHGGRDQGAAHNGLWEHDYVYDILCRIKGRLEQQTGAKVLPTIKDRQEGYQIHDSTRLIRNQAEVLLTDPPIPLTERAPSVNLRWYLSNAYYRRIVGAGQDPRKVVFASLHADARHPSLGGAMVYVPGEQFRRGRYGHDGAAYVKHREVREQPYVSFTRNERERSEGLSRQFAGRLIEAFRRRGVAVHPYGPVRERIIRRGRSWVPAVLRCNLVPVEVLIEVSNLSNPADSRLLADPAYREKVAEAYIDALQAFYAAPSRPVPRPAAVRGGR